jgi:hypothetical protein
MDPRAVARELAQSARDLEAGAGFPAAYVGRARAEAGGLTSFDPSDRETGEGEEVYDAARLLQACTGTDPVVVVAGTWAPRPVGQRLARRLIHWYLEFLSGRVGEIGRAAARVGPAVAGRLDRIEGRQVAGRRALHAEVAVLRDRVGRLEGRGGGEPPGDASEPLPTG